MDHPDRHMSLLRESVLHHTASLVMPSVLSDQRDEPDRLKRLKDTLISMPDHPDKMLNKLTDDALLMDPRAFSENARALEKYDYLDELAKLEAQVLFLGGEKDTLITEALLKPTADRLPNAEIKVLDHVGHAVNVEDPQRFIRILKDFFGGNSV